jgi:hypothetical protein
VHERCVRRLYCQAQMLMFDCYTLVPAVSTLKNLFGVPMTDIRKMMVLVSATMLAARTLAEPDSVRKHNSRCAPFLI